MELAVEIGKLLHKHKLTLAVAESATGGLIANLITDIPGSSDYFKGSVVAYDNEIKTKVLGVQRGTIEQYGAVSQETGKEMAEGIRKLMNTDIGLSDTGIAGPTGATAEKPLGLFYIGLASPKGTWVGRYIFPGGRLENKRDAAEAALNMLKNHLQAEVIDMEQKHVVTCFLEHKGKICLLRRSEKVGTYKGKWAGVSGYIEEGNTPFDQVLEELLEEVKLTLEDIELVRQGQELVATDEKLGRRWIVHPFRFRVIKPEKLEIDWEHTESKWIDPEDIAQYETVPKLPETWERVK